MELDEKAWDEWFESLTLEEKKELWVQCVEEVLELLDQLTEE